MLTEDSLERVVVAGRVGGADLDDAILSDEVGVGRRRSRRGKLIAPEGIGKVMAQDAHVTDLECRSAGELILRGEGKLLSGRRLEILGPEIERGDRGLTGWKARRC